MSWHIPTAPDLQPEPVMRRCLGCPYPGLILASEMSQHVAAHHQEYAFKCKPCQVSFTLLFRCKKHLNLVLGGQLDNGLCPVKLCFPAKRSKTGRSRKSNLCPKKVFNQAHFDYVIQTIHM